MKGRKSIAIIVLLIVLVSNIFYAYAEETGETEIIFTSEPLQIKFTAPLRLPVHLNSDGTIETANDCYLQNLSASGGIKVVEVKITEKNGWSLEEFYGFDYINLPVNSKKYGFKIFDDIAEKNTGIISADSAEWVVIPSSGLIEVEEDGVIRYEDNVGAMENRLYLTYDARAGAQASEVAEIAVGGVEFTVDFDYAE